MTPALSEAQEQEILKVADLVDGLLQLGYSPQEAGELLMNSQSIVVIRP